VSRRSLLVAARLASGRFWLRYRAKLRALQPESDPREVVKEPRTSGGSGDGEQLLGDAREEVSHRSGSAQGQDDAADAHVDNGGNLQQLEPECPRTTS